MAGFYGLLGLLGVTLAAPASGAQPSVDVAWSPTEQGSSRIIRAPGRLVVGPTEEFSGGSFPYGGVEVGRVMACALQPLGQPYVVDCEGLGGTGDVLEPPHRYVFACFVRGWSDDGIELLLPDHWSAGDVSQHAVVSIPGDRPAGSSELAHSVVVAFIPDDPMHVPGILMYRAVPGITSGAEFAFSRNLELGLPLTFDLLDDSSGRIVKVGRLEDLDL